MYICTVIKNKEKMTTIKEFRSQENLDKFRDNSNNKRKYRMQEVFINNSFGLELTTKIQQK